MLTTVILDLQLELKQYRKPFPTLDVIKTSQFIVFRGNQTAKKGLDKEKEV